ncbi:translocon-associated protein subunit alpha-like [Hoplias malabaricus]|uniref:translocon-associated protein subunit alpha-like n=1 Tax=Hoplias malabaricus TaxID=27720 RepID=UPI0034632B68
MFEFGSKFMLLFLLSFPCALFSHGNGVLAETDPDLVEEVSDEVLDAAVEEEEDDDDDDEEGLVEESQTEDTDGADAAAHDEDEDAQGSDVTSHPDADTTIIFIPKEEFPANEIVKCLVGFTNNGSEDFTVQSLEASFRYPQDFQFYIQNFTALPLEMVVPSKKQASFEYSFIPAAPMAGRPFGLVILLNYRDSQGNGFQNAVYNQTVTITELDEGLDGETMFMYIFLSGLVVLLVFGMYQVLDTRTRKRVPVKVETGTGGMKNVDISWIPQETLNIMNKASPRASPRKRATRTAGTDQ